MEIVELKKGIYWVGAVDWNIRDFHGYSTPSGTTYNAYLNSRREKCPRRYCQAPFYLEMMGRISEILIPRKSISSFQIMSRWTTPVRCPGVDGLETLSSSLRSEGKWGWKNITKDLLTLGL